MQSKKSVECRFYDLAEAACVRSATVELVTSDGQNIEGTAIDIQASDDAEFLVLDAPGRRLLVRLSAVVEMAMIEEDFSQGAS